MVENTFLKIEKGNILNATKPVFKVLAVLVLVVGAALRVVVWWQQRSIFLDEANLIRNWTEKPYAALWGNLDYEQYAPPIFSILSKALLSVLGNTELTVRLLPLLCGIGMLYFFYKIGHALLSPLTLFLASIFVAWGHLFLQYSSECKQYSCDGLIAMALVFFALKQEKTAFSLKNAWFWALGGSLAIWASMPSVFVLAGVGAFLLWKNKNEKAALLRVLLVIGSWLLMFGIYFFTLLHEQAQLGNLKNYHADAFLAFPPLSLADLNLLGIQLADLISSSIGHTAVCISLTVLCLGAAFYGLWKKNRGLLLLLALPVFCTLAASAMEYYSLIGRLVLFMVPLVILLVFAGLDVFLALRKKVLTGCLLLLFLVPIANKQQLYAFFAPLKTDFPAVKTGLDHIAKNQKQGDVLFAYHVAAPVVRYYTQHRTEPLFFENVVLEKYRCCDDDLVQQDLSKLLADWHKRIWLIYDRAEYGFLKDFVAEKGGKTEQELPFYRGVAFLAVFP